MPQETFWLPAAFLYYVGIVWFLAQKLKFISYAPDCLEYPFVGYALKLFAKTLYVNVNCTRVAEIIESQTLSRS